MKLNFILFIIFKVNSLKMSEKDGLFSGYLIDIDVNKCRYLCALLHRFIQGFITKVFTLLHKQDLYAI